MSLLTALAKCEMHKPAHYTTKLIERNWLSDTAFELTYERPGSFSFTPGQKIEIDEINMPREYTIASAPVDPHIQLCIRKVDGGRISSALSEKAIGSDLHFHGPCGYFNFTPTDRQPVFVATGTGIAPFVSMIRSGVTEVTLLHGVRQVADLYYRSEVEAAARRYIPIISEELNMPKGHFSGRVTEFIENKLPQGTYDFYLCGSGQMIRDVILLIDQRFEGSRVFTEKFY